MSRLTVALLAAAVALAAGCMTAAPVIERQAPSGEVALAPAGAPGLASQADYGFEAALKYRTYDSEDPGGQDLSSTDVWTLGFTWYMGGVADDDTPYALQPFMQRSNLLRFGLGSGDREIGPLPDWDIGVVELGCTLVHPEYGVGIALDSRRVSEQSAGAIPINFSSDELDAEIFWRNGSGFQAGLTLVKASKHWYYEEELGAPLIVATMESGYRAVRLGARKVFKAGEAGAVDLAGSVEFGNFDVLDLFASDGSSAVYRLEVAYYPVKIFGFGIGLKSRALDADTAPFDDLESLTIAASATVTIAGRIDLSLDYSSFETDSDTAGLVESADAFSVTVGVRF